MKASSPSPAEAFTAEDRQPDSWQLRQLMLPDSTRLKDEDLPHEDLPDQDHDTGRLRWLKSRCHS